MTPNGPMIAGKVARPGGSKSSNDPEPAKNRWFPDDTVLKSFLMRAIPMQYVGALWPLIVACGQTSYDLYEPVGAAVGSGGSAEATGGTTLTDSGGTGGTAAPGGAGPVDEPDPCRASRDPTLLLTRVTLAGTNLCLSQGAATTFLESPGYEVIMTSCAEDEAQWWSVEGLSGGSWELRNEATNLNLDINYSAQTDGTPAVLFDPHRNFNQRFYIVPGPNESILFAPANTTGKCLEVRGDGVEMWPCDSQNPNQTFRQISCVDE